MVKGPGSYPSSKIAVCKLFQLLWSTVSSSVKLGGLIRTTNIRPALKVGDTAVYTVEILIVELLLEMAGCLSVPLSYPCSAEE